ncbi:hypothetical protein COW36_19705 [bacterium (Candidatus Blackallbacteria) CG17_big_fil_post_rev_8_21_14_2_50_48_46]|uniref:Outer membrane lipoprotein carrier protein LolA n=1 Tax=bacterium (Candidatus Blackallbacteria) CG17_big_fil_post_rev_8_21_14_2_50_48_46 TaxID=2014261 RepID=A0A2M7FZV9_9BACT|nr:MAG: hypothetical protein COW64_15590 [bacterium (Candidatus Blackallbacteria) CG18_big_fil_WC_8_21_14_2_50_49_26]PIW14879.1 MAG: hypothetical protein COW36_19705 [bacterium (Candidatus Blackallbacteria) CG17_big_fil_post_rev_8_21_14_2_50_48_46]PIW44446.1 MAG: hypothetical protein COW20_24280 [bacterium (Candidatus Blackallbacteria) CG13_big_fil_rev_8_21_14_2_50_49_14]
MLFRKMSLQMLVCCCLFLHMGFNRPAFGHGIPGQPEIQIPIEIFEKYYHLPFFDILEHLGPPSAHYHYQGDEYWLYEKPLKTDSSGFETWPEIRIKKGRGVQVNWLPLKILHPSIEIAKSFGEWTPPHEIREKKFFLKDTQLKGISKAKVLKKLGEPDCRRVFQGIEIWEYGKVRLSAKNPKQLTLLIEFKGSRVTRSLGA